MDTLLSKLIFLELGKQFESRDSFLDACRYYEWAENQSDEESFKRAIRIRWIACKERQSEYEDKDPRKQEAYKKEASDKRRDVQLSTDYKIPEVPALSNGDWEELFAYYIKINNDEIVTTKNIDDPFKNEYEHNPNVKKDRPPLQKQVLQYSNYSIISFPTKGDVVIKDTENEYQVRIKNGRFPDGSDFYLKDGRIFVSDDDIQTPFLLERTDNLIVFKIFDGDIYTGISITIALN